MGAIRFIDAPGSGEGERVVPRREYHQNGHHSPIADWNVLASQSKVQSVVKCWLIENRSNHKYTSKSSLNRLDNALMASKNM